MSNSVPMWWMRSSRCCPQPEKKPKPEPLPELPPDPPPVQSPMQSPPQAQPIRDAVSSLTQRIKSTDPETMLLLALLWLLWQEHADRKLLLALAYIIL